MRILMVNQYSSYPEMKLFMPGHPWILCLNGGHEVKSPCFLGWG